MSPTHGAKEGAHPKASTRPVSLLLVEDRARDAQLLEAWMREGGLRFELTRVQTRDDFNRVLSERSFDLILADYNVPGFEGTVALASARLACPHTPFIFVSGALGDEKAIELLKRGATDYVLKHRLERLIPSVERALREAQEREGLRRAEAEREQVTRRLQLLAEASKVLESSLEYEQTLQNVVQLVMPELADFGFFDVAQEDGSVRRVARAHQDPRRQALLDASQWVHLAPEDGLNLCALSSGRPAVHPVIDEVWLRRAAQSEAHLQAMRALDFCSMLTVPLHYQSRLLGALTLFYADSRRRYSDADRVTVVELGQRAAAAVENARLFRAQVRARTEVEALAKVLAERESEAQRRAEFQEQLLGIVGHDLRNPLNAILMSAAFVRSRASDERALVALGRIAASADRASRIISDLLDLTQARLGGGITVAPRVCDLAPVLSEVVEEHRAAQAEREFRLEVLGDLTGEWDADRLAQVLANLLGNAAQYGRASTAITVRAHGEPGQVSLCVHNWGEPIPEPVRQSLFQPFKRGHSERAQKSLGLGLYIVERLVCAHGGTVACHSAQEEGTTFTVKLPRRSGA